MSYQDMSPLSFIPYQSKFNQSKANRLHSRYSFPSFPSFLSPITHHPLTTHPLTFHHTNTSTNTRTDLKGYFFCPP